MALESSYNKPIDLEQEIRRCLIELNQKNKQLALKDDHQDSTNLVKLDQLANRLVRLFEELQRTGVINQHQETLDHYIEGLLSRTSIQELLKN